MLRYTGHPFVDVGVATIAAFAGKRHPQDVTLDDLEGIAGYLKDIYCHYKPVQNYISVIFHNSMFSQPKATIDGRKDYADRVLFLFRQDYAAESNKPNCIFFPELAAQLNATRQYIPLLNGVEIGNFSGMGYAGLPISGVALLAIHAMPLGCYKCGNLLAFHQLNSPQDPTGGFINFLLAKGALEKNRKAITNIRVDKDATMPNWGSSVRTRYVEALLKAQHDLDRRELSLENITGYYFTNYADKAKIDILRLNNQVAAFVNAAQQDMPRSWRNVVYQGWQRPKGKDQADTTPENTKTWRNRVYETLFDLPQKSRLFIRYLLHGHDWELLVLFLRKVMQMEQERIDTYRQLGDRLAHYAITYENQPVSFYYSFSRAKDYYRLRKILQSAEERMLKANSEQLLFKYEEFILAFEHPSDGYRQWKLGRDLIAFRMLEVLHAHRIDTAELPDEPPSDDDDEDQE